MAEDTGLGKGFNVDGMWVDRSTRALCAATICWTHDRETAERIIRALYAFNDVDEPEYSFRPVETGDNVTTV